MAPMKDSNGPSKRLSCSFSGTYLDLATFSWQLAKYSVTYFFSLTTNS